MKRRPSFVTYFIMIAMIGVISSIVSSDLPFGAIMGSLEIDSTEQLLEYLSLGLAFITAACLFIYWIYRSITKDRDQDSRSVWNAENWKGDD